MSEKLVRKIALFFFFAFLDERQSIIATKKVIQKILKSSSFKDYEPSYFDENSSVIIFQMEKVWRALKDSRNLSFTSFDMEAGWILPEEVNLGLWRQFLKDASETELITLILSQILHFSDSDISKGLGVTTGTVRMRTSHALRRLGALRL